MKAIRQKCLDCCNGQMKEVRSCTVKNCPLFAFRNGKRPKGEEFVIEDSLIEKS